MKRIFTVLAAVLLLTAAMAVTASASDYDAVAEDLSAIGVFRGTSSGFELDRAPTRSEAAIMLVRLYGAEDEAKTAYEAGDITMPFTDVGATAAPYVAWLHDQGIVNGTSATTYGTGACSAQNYVVFLLRALGYEDGTDFAYADALTFAQEKGFYDPLMFSGTFLRDDLAAVTYQALGTDLKDGSTYLLKSLIDSGAVDATAAAPMTEKIEAYRVLQQAGAGVDGTAMDADVDADITVSYNGQVSEDMSMRMSGNMKVAVTEDDVQLAYMMDIDALGETMTMGEWMTGGWVYVQTEVGGETVRTKTQVTSEEMQALLEQAQSTATAAAPANSVSGLAMVESITRTTSGANTVYTVVIGQNSMGSMMDSILGLLGTDAGTDLSGMEDILGGMEFSDITAVYTVGSDGRLQDMQMQYATTMNMDGETVETAYDMTVTVNATGSDVTITFPDFSGFEEVTVPETDTPAAAEETSHTVYVTATGKRYHYDSSCNGGTYYESTLEEALGRGLTPCEKCVL